MWCSDVPQSGEMMKMMVGDQSRDNNQMVCCVFDGLQNEHIGLTQDKKHSIVFDAQYKANNGDTPPNGDR